MAYEIKKYKGFAKRDFNKYDDGALVKTDKTLTEMNSIVKTVPVDVIHDDVYEEVVVNMFLETTGEEVVGTHTVSGMNVSGLLYFLNLISFKPDTFEVGGSPMKGLLVEMETDLLFTDDGDWDPFPPKYVGKKPTLLYLSAITHNNPAYLFEVPSLMASARAKTGPNPEDISEVPNGLCDFYAFEDGTVEVKINVNPGQSCDVTQIKFTFSIPRDLYLKIDFS